MLDIDPTRRRSSSRAVVHVGRARPHGRRRSRRSVERPARQVGIAAAQPARPRRRAARACCWPAAAWSSINPSRGDERTTRRHRRARPAVIIGDRRRPGRAASGRRPRIDGDRRSRRSTPSRAGGGRRRPRRRAARPGVAVRMLTSGTTGPPKRIDLTYDMLAHSVIGRQALRDGSPTPTEVRSGRRDRQLAAGAPRRRVPGAAVRRRGRPFALLERFDLDGWADAVRSHRPRAVSLVPAALRMVLHSDLDPRGPRRHPRRHVGHRAAFAPTTPTPSARSSASPC